jgi:NTP pyrophosphatase (non-canonical NTP hydrolase)
VNSYERVKLSRERTAGSFPFPALRPSLDYAICEFAGELRDAVLRDERGGDVRNTDKAHSQRAELGDAFYMLLSACIQANHEPVLHPTIATYSFPRHCNEIVRHLLNAADQAGYLEDDRIRTSYAQEVLCRNLDHAYSYMYALCAHGYGWPVIDVVDDACQKFERRHAAAREVK